MKKLSSLFFVFILLFAHIAMATTYYVSTTGSDTDNGSSSAPWATFSHAISFLQPGDTLYIKDGTYNQSLTVTVSGTSGNPITIKALNDGAVTIDGQNVRRPCDISGVDDANHISYIDFEGIVCQNSSAEVVRLHY